MNNLGHEGGEVHSPTIQALVEELARVTAERDLARAALDAGNVEGLTLRDYFAAAALPSLTAEQTGNAALIAYQFADAMMAVR